MNKIKYSIDEKLKICIDKEENELSNAELSLKYSVPKTTIRSWLREYQKLGNCAFQRDLKRKNKIYTSEFRVSVVKEKLNTNVSYNELGRKYGINKCVIQSWVYKYEKQG